MPTSATKTGRIRRLSQLSWYRTGMVVLPVAVVGVIVVLFTHASGTPIAFEAESGTLAAAAAATSITGQSGTGAVKFTAGATPTPTGTPSGVPNPLKIMPLGDSLTQGGVNANASGVDASTINGYRLALWNLLNDYTIDYVGSDQLGNSQLPDHDEDGFSGACIKASPCGGGTLYPQTAGWLTTYRPDLVIMQGGENDFSDSSMTEAQDATNMESWIQLVWATLPNAKIIVSGAPWHDNYDALVHTYCTNLQNQGKPIRWVPYGDSIGRIDGTHPNAVGYITWAGELAPMVRELFPK